MNPPTEKLPKRKSKLKAFSKHEDLSAKKLKTEQEKTINNKGALETSILPSKELTLVFERLVPAQVKSDKKTSLDLRDNVNSKTLSTASQKNLENFKNQPTIDGRLQSSEFQDPNKFNKTVLKNNLNITSQPQADSPLLTWPEKDMVNGNQKISSAGSAEEDSLAEKSLDSLTYMWPLAEVFEEFYGHGPVEISDNELNSTAWDSERSLFSGSSVGDLENNNATSVQESVINDCFLGTSPNPLISYVTDENFFETNLNNIEENGNLSIFQTNQKPAKEEEVIEISSEEEENFKGSKMEAKQKPTSLVPCKPSLNSELAAPLPEPPVFWTKTEPQSGLPSFYYILVNSSPLETASSSVSSTEASTRLDLHEVPRTPENKTSKEENQLSVTNSKKGSRASSCKSKPAKPKQQVAKSSLKSKSKNLEKSSNLKKSIKADLHTVPNSWNFPPQETTDSPVSSELGSPGHEPSEPSLWHTKEPVTPCIWNSHLPRNHWPLKFQEIYQENRLLKQTVKTLHESKIIKQSSINPPETIDIDKLVSECKKYLKPVPFEIVSQTMKRSYYNDFKPGIRWSKDVKLLCRTIFNRSPEVYRMLQKYLTLPDVKTIMALPKTGNVISADQSNQQEPLEQLNTESGFKILSFVSPLKISFNKLSNENNSKQSNHNDKNSKC